MEKNKKFLIINGPNLNMLGTRQPEIYGSLSLLEIEEYTKKSLDGKCLTEWFQSNIEGEIVTRIQTSIKENFSALIINPGAYAHSSVAIFDALSMLKIPIIEVHLSNTHKREDFRQVKITAKASTIMMEGLLKNAYLVAINSQLL